MPEVNLTIDGATVHVEAGTTILQAAAAAGVHIPTICYHEACTANGLCRMCVVEVKGARLLQPSCIAAVGEGMEVTTRSERVDRARRTILEMLDSAVDLSQAPEIQTQMSDYAAQPERFPGGRAARTAGDRRQPDVRA